MKANAKATSKAREQRNKRETSVGARGKTVEAPSPERGTSLNQIMIRVQLKRRESNDWAMSRESRARVFGTRRQNPRKLWPVLGERWAFYRGAGQGKTKLVVLLLSRTEACCALGLRRLC
jgi:hypothetical protein